MDSSHRIRLLPLLLVVLVTLEVRSGVSRPPPETINGHDFGMPFATARMVYRRGSDAPAPVEEFLRRNGRRWRIWWDASLSTPRLVYPLDAVPIVPPGPRDGPLDSAALHRAVLDFVDEQQALFGVSASALTEPRVFAAAAGTAVLVFGQRNRDGLRIRGASLRCVILRETGRLYFITSFLLRGPAPEAAWVLTRNDAISAAEENGLAVKSAELQLAFSAGKGEPPFPAWALEVGDSGGGAAELLVDAQSGEIVVRRSVEQYFLTGGQTFGWAPCLDCADEHLRAPTGPSILGPIAGVTIRHENGNVLTVTGEDGRFFANVAETRLTLRAELEHGIFLKGRAGSFRKVLSVVPATEETELELEPGEDLDRDGIPDLELTQSTSRPYIFVFNEKIRPPAAAAFRNLWLQCFSIGVRYVRFIETALVRAQVDDDVRRFPCVNIRPSAGARTPRYRSPGDADGCGHVEIGLQSLLTHCSGARWREWFTAETVPTVIAHELGHHVLYQVVGRTTATRLCGIPEGMADAKAAMFNDDCRLYYRAPNDDQEVGFCLASNADGLRQDPLRIAIGDVFWKLYETWGDLGRGANNRSMKLLLNLMVEMRQGRADMPLFVDRFAFVDLLLLVNDLEPLGGDLVPENGSPFEDDILEAFRGHAFLDDVFIRGDANLDRRINVADAVAILGFLFDDPLRRHDCRNAMDTDNSGILDISDGISLLMFLFAGGAAPAAPFPDCGLDPERPDRLGNMGCVEFTCPR